MPPLAGADEEEKQNFVVLSKRTNEAEEETEENKATQAELCSKPEVPEVFGLDEQDKLRKEIDKAENEEEAMEEGAEEDKISLKRKYPHSRAFEQMEDDLLCPVSPLQ